MERRQKLTWESEQAQNQALWRAHQRQILEARLRQASLQETRRQFNNACERFLFDNACERFLREFQINSTTIRSQGMSNMYNWHSGYEICYL